MTTTRSTWSSFPNSVWERYCETPFRGSHSKQSFVPNRSRTEFGNEDEDLSFSCSLCLCGSLLFADDKPPVPVLKKKSPDALSSPWLPTLADGKTQAQKLKQPIFVRVGGPGCPWCKKLEQELTSLRLKDELPRWTLVEYRRRSRGKGCGGALGRPDPGVTAAFTWWPTGCIGRWVSHGRSAA